MTTIVFVETPSGVDVAFDSQVSYGSRKGELAQSKVFKAGEIVYGVAGAVSVANILETLEIRAPSITDIRELELWVTKHLVARIKQALVETGTAEKEYFSGSILAIVNNRVFEIGSDYSRVRNSSGNYSIGSGSSYALGALQMGANAKEAVKTAAHYDAYTGYEIKEMHVPRAH